MNEKLQNSKTKDNLLRAFAGESQAKNRYLFSADVAKKNNLYVIQTAFEFTAKQEMAHAKVYYDHLKELSGTNITIDANYPIDNYDNVLKLLRSAEHNENQEYEFAYSDFAKIAKQEGFTAISNSFELIAKIENTHAKRFSKLGDYVEMGTLFKDSEQTVWMCLNCGHIYIGATPPTKCPVCSHPQGYFIRKEWLNM